MDPLWLLLIVPAAVIVGVFGAYYANTYKGMGEPKGRELAASVLEARGYHKVASQIRSGMRSSNWPEDRVDPGCLLDLLEKIES